MSGVRFRDAFAYGGKLVFVVALVAVVGGALLVGGVVLGIQPLVDGAAVTDPSVLAGAALSALGLFVVFLALTGGAYKLVADGAEAGRTDLSPVTSSEADGEAEAPTETTGDEVDPAGAGAAAAADGVASGGDRRTGRNAGPAATPGAASESQSDHPSAQASSDSGTVPDADSRTGGAPEAAPEDSTAGAEEDWEQTGTADWDDADGTDRGGAAGADWSEGTGERDESEWDEETWGDRKLPPEERPTVEEAEGLFTDDSDPRSRRTTGPHTGDDPLAGGSGPDTPNADSGDPGEPAESDSEPEFEDASGDPADDGEPTVDELLGTGPTDLDQEGDDKDWPSPEPADDPPADADDEERRSDDRERD